MNEATATEMEFVTDSDLADGFLRDARELADEWVRGISTDGWHWAAQAVVRAQGDLAKASWALLNASEDFDADDRIPIWHAMTIVLELQEMATIDAFEAGLTDRPRPISGVIEC